MSAQHKPLVIGIDLGGTKCHGVLAELDGRGITHDIRPTDPDDAYGTLMGCAGWLQGRAAAAGRAVAAVGLGVPAVIDPPSGRAFGGPNISWDGFPLGWRITDDLGLPVVVENDADLAALGEARRGAARDLRDFVVVSIGTGIGGAVVVDGRLVKGRHNTAGEFGAMVFDRARLRVPTRGGLGSFERQAAGPGIASHAAGLMAADHITARSSLQPDGLTARTVFAAARNGDAVARATIDSVLDEIAMALIALISTLDPAAIILDGGVGRALGPQLDDLVGRVMGHAPSTPTVTISQLEPTSTLVGALVAAAEVAGNPVDAPYLGTLVRSMELVTDELTGQLR